MGKIFTTDPHYKLSPESIAGAEALYREMGIEPPAGFGKTKVKLGAKATQPIVKAGEKVNINHVIKTAKNAAAMEKHVAATQKAKQGSTTFLKGLSPEEAAKWKAKQRGSLSFKPLKSPVGWNKAEGGEGPLTVATYRKPSAGNWEISEIANEGMPDKHIFVVGNRVSGSVIHPEGGRGNFLSLQDAVKALGAHLKEK